MTRSKAAALLERIVRIIPGIAGYQDRELRRSTDKAIRERAAQSIGRCREGLSRVIEGLSRGGGISGLESIGPLENLANRLERLEDGLRYASYGYAGWFDSTGVTLEDLERLYEYDLDLLTKAESLAGMIPGSGEAPGQEDWLSQLSKKSDLLQRSVEGRKRVMEGEG